MIDANNWILTLVDKLKITFKETLLFVGLQGSYQRGEATENSDIDIMVVLENLGTDELATYKRIISDMPYNEKACGFISGKKELLSWPKFEIFQLAHETKPYYGELKNLIPEIKQKDIIDSIRISASGIYHAACHSYLYDDKDKSIISLKEFYKGAFFLLQMLYYIHKGIYVHTKKELFPLLCDLNKEILSISLQWNNNIVQNKDNLNFFYDKIIKWTSNILIHDFKTN